MKSSLIPRHTLPLRIASLFVRINFFPSEYPYFIEKSLYERLKFTYRGFPAPKISKEDIVINFYHQSEFKVLINNSKTEFFINYYNIDPGRKISTYYHISDFQFQVILRNAIQKHLVKKKGIFIHASASLINKKAALFLGPSSSGKSTIVRLIAENFEALADDSIFILNEGKNYIAYQTPIIEKNFQIIRRYRKIPLGGIFLLKKSKNFKIHKINTKEDTAKLLLKQVLTDEPDIKEQIPNLLKLSADFEKFYILEFGLNDREILVELLKKYV